MKKLRRLLQLISIALAIFVCGFVVLHVITGISQFWYSVTWLIACIISLIFFAIVELIT